MGKKDKWFICSTDDALKGQWGQGSTSRAGASISRLIHVENESQIIAAVIFVDCVWSCKIIIVGVIHFHQRPQKEIEQEMTASTGGISQ